MGEILGRAVSGAEAVSREQWPERLKAGLDALGIAYDPAAPERLARYHQLLTEWNQVMNLTGDTDFETSLTRHYLDSLAPLGISGLFPEKASLIDVGTGAGFPGLPLAIARPDLDVVLMDSLQKRLNFLDAVVKELGLSNVRLCHARAEDGGRDPRWRETFDLAVARGVAALPVLAELLLPFVRVGGKAVCYKGPAAEEEWDAGQRAARLLGGGKLERTPIVLPGQEDWEHCVIALPKEAKTVRQYPRKAGTPGREPLGQTGGRKQEAQNGKSAPSER